MKRKYRALVLVLLIAAAAFVEIPAAKAIDLGGLLGGLTSWGSSGETYGLGEEANVEDAVIKLVNVMQSSGNSYYQPAEGKEYVLFEFSIKNIAREEMAISSMMSFTTWCDNRLCTISLEALSTGMLAGKYQLDCVVEAGGNVTGVVGYEVDKGWKEIKVEFRREALFGEKVTFLVKEK